MNDRITNKELFVRGMTCNGCGLKIERKLKSLDGVIKAKANYAGERVIVTYDENKLSLSMIKQAIGDAGYRVIYKSEKAQVNKKLSVLYIAASLIALLSMYVILKSIGVFNFFNYFPKARESMSYSAIFVIGLLTSLHCIGMCGGINLSQCIGASEKTGAGRMQPSFLYNLGRIISYTVIGGGVGALGSLISFTGTMRGAVALFAGVFMIIMGLNMLNVFSWLRGFSLSMPGFITENTLSISKRPLFIGALNGFMPCGPLQAMQVYALSTGSFAKGAMSMFLFALGTSPLMFGFGAISSLLSKKFTAKMMTASAVLVILLGLGMLNTGLSMSGFIAPGTERSNADSFKPTIVDGYQVVQAEVKSNSYAPVTVKKNIPVKFNLHAESENLNSCNGKVIIPEYNIQIELKPGDNIVEFTPTETGVFPYSCWMNMIGSSITVVD